ncbi:hypothetical protein CVT26_008371 [Gymnopilus dilepis]|uniref:Uncharacterized protein n=1 Tax=Gymnopilus dilepis TaxID=231916 RepID=A0A409XY76_9AGAR|nr:hypothetical protein CVT26_008371 [Gymnopilus dilepis]
MFPTCSLTTAIVSGSIWTSELNTPDKKDNEQQLKANTYSITISHINLSALDGDANYKGGGEDTITFPSNVQSDRYIVVDIPTSGKQLYYAVDYPAGFNPPSAMKSDSLLTALKSFFKTNIKSIAYTLAQINNHKPTNGVLDLVPQAFRFVTYDVDPKVSKLSFLTLLIQTKSGGVAPVPKTESASIIINNDFFFKVFIKPGLKQASSVTNQVVPSSDSLGGIRAQSLEQWPLQYEWSELDVPAVQYDPNNISPLKLTFGLSNGFGKPATLNLYWQYKYKSTCTGRQVKRYSIKEPGGPLQWLPSIKKQNGSFVTTYTLNKTISLTDLTDEDLSINIGADPGSTNPGSIPTFVSNTAMRGISFKFTFGTLRFFSVTNVLLPGEKVIDVSIKNGLGIPRDCVIVGNVVESRSAFADLQN